MKKLLIATTALVATASVAAADVSVGGTARVGINYNDGATDSTTLEYRMRVNIKATGETDNGLTFGAFTRFNLDENPAAGESDRGANGPRVWFGGSNWTVTAGNTDGAALTRANAYPIALGIDAGWAHLAEPLTWDGTQGFDESSSNGSGPKILKLDLDFDSFGASISTDIAGNGDTELGLSYSVAGFDLGFGYNDGNADGSDAYIISAGYSANGVTVNVAYADDSTAGSDYSIGAKYKLANGMGIGASYNDGDSYTNAAYGIGMDYSLGGGATFKAALGKDEAKNTRGSLGLNFKF